jgi:hypothetical protein
MNLFDFGFTHQEPHVCDVIPDVEWEGSYDIGGHPSSPRSFVWIYGTCGISTKWPWCITPDHLMEEGE